MAPTIISSLNSPFSLITSFPPNPPSSTNSSQLQSQSRDSPQRIAIHRREIALLLSSIGALHATPAFAFNLGISGPKEWLKEQKKKSAKFILAPIDASRDILRYAYQLLRKDTVYNEKDMEEVRKLLRSAARDCVAEERNSFVTFQAKTGVEVCTFRLIVNNASSLLNNKDPIKLEAEAMLVDLIRSFASLNGMVTEADIQLVSDREKIADAVKDTISSLNKFEQGINNCLEV